MMLDEKIIDDVLKPDTGRLADSKINEFIVLYDKEHFFEPINYFVKGIFLKNEKSQLYLVFSKPENDYLLAELHIDYYNDRPSNYQSFSKVGSYYKILFLFDEKGRVKKFFCNQVHQ
jgi:hypothetical protein